MPPERPAFPEPPPSQRGILCPYCGSVSSSDPKRCERCGGHFDPLSRQATQNAMGPWFIRDVASPFRPGCSFETLRELIKRGKVTRETILRGPSTRQYWNFASRTPGIANLLGVCHNCHVPVRPDDFSCAACGAVFSPETDRQHMGLAPVHLLPGQASPEIIAAASVDHARHAPAPRRPIPQHASLPVSVAQARASDRPRALGTVVIVLIALGAVAVGVIRFVLPVLRNEVAVATPAPAGRPPAVNPTPEPAPSPQSPTAPAPTGSTEPSASVAPEPRADPRPALLTSLVGEPFDGPALLRQIDDLSKSGALDQRDVWAALVRQRGEQLRLRSLP